jgi:uncharacterized membrane protein
MPTAGDLVRRNTRVEARRMPSSKTRVDAWRDMRDQAPAAVHQESRWGAAAAILAAVAMQVSLPQSLTFGPTLLLPAVEVVLLTAVLATNPNRLSAESRDMRWASLVLAGVIALANAASLALLVDALLNGGDTSGRTLILSALGIWLTNVVVFALVYWEVDRRGPHERSTGGQAQVDLLFPQMTQTGPSFSAWAPTFADYLYVSFTNSMAFSPTDTMPLTRSVKMVMLVQSLLSLVTIALVGARAVNILA